MNGMDGAWMMKMMLRVFRLPETNMSPLKIGLAPKRNRVFQQSIFRGYISFKEGSYIIWGSYRYIYRRLALIATVAVSMVDLGGQ